MVHIIEERLISRDLGGELERILRDDLAQGRNPVLDPGMRFFISDGQGSYAMPPALDQLDVGFHEVFEGDLSFHALVRDIDGRRFVLLQDQSDFEAREQVLYASVLTGYVLSIALAGLLGWMLARKVMEPVVRLARQVRHREQLLGLAPPLAPDYANDEVGELAASFDETLGRLRDALKREQLFTSDVSHELRTPLMVIATSCELLAEEPSLGPRARGQLERMTKATEEMRDLVQTFLLLARAQKGEESLAPHGSLESIADDLVQVWREQVEARGLTLHYRNEGACAGQFNAAAARGDGQPVAQRDPLHRCREHHADPRRAWFQRRGHRGGRPGRTTRTHLHALRSWQFQLRTWRRPWPGALAGEADLRGRGLERNPQRGGAARLPVRSFTRCCLTKNSPPLDPSLTAGFIPFVS